MNKTITENMADDLQSKVKKNFPIITFESGWLMDNSLSENNGVKLNSQAINEISSRIDEFQNAWNKKGSKLIEVVLENNNIKFKEKDIKGVLIYSNFPSMSHPLIINVKKFLKTFENTPRSMNEFVETVFHELLHILLQDNADLSIWPTKAILGTQEKDFSVMAHLHLMALEKQAHKNLDNECLWLSNWYAEAGASYIKSWELVSDPLLYENLINEINTVFTFNQENSSNTIS